MKNVIEKNDLALLNSKRGLKLLLSMDKPDPLMVLNQLHFEQEMSVFQVQMVQLQRRVIEQHLKVVILFEGRDAAGKGGAIRSITKNINPRHFRSIALNKPTEEEKGQWYFQRYTKLLPNPGEMVFFDRSWYNRAMVEPVNGFCTEEEYQEFMKQVNDYERMLVHSSTFLLKIYFQIDRDEQKRRFEEIRKSNLSRWKMTKVDEKAQDLWDKYTTYEKEMLDHTHTVEAPWRIIPANNSQKAYIEAIHYILNAIKTS